MVYDIGIYWDRGQSKLRQGWVAANLFSHTEEREQIALLRRSEVRARRREEVWREDHKVCRKV